MAWPASTGHAEGMTNSEWNLGGELRIKRLGFGAMRLPVGSFTGPTRDPESGRAVLRRVLELGVNHIDTAAFYRRDDVSANALIRDVVPADVVVATKVGPILGSDGVPSLEATPEQLRGQVEQNLKELGRDVLDLVYLRVGGMGGNEGASIADRFAVLAGLRSEGLIRHLGVSNVDAGQLAEARAIAEVAAVQNEFQVTNQRGRDILEICERDGIAFVPFFPLGGGRTPLDHSRLEKIAARHDATVPQLALAWLLASSPVILAIPGTGTIPHLEENLAAAEIDLTAADLADLTF
jgi:aryl-alcohol dehydrogenase-like predicted oxidoreductase